MCSRLLPQSEGIVINLSVSRRSKTNVSKHLAHGIKFLPSHDTHRRPSLHELYDEVQCLIFGLGVEYLNP